MILVQLSDTHFGTEQPHVVEALVAWMREHEPDILVFSGDITQRARRAQFRAAREFIDRIPRHDLLTVPGNHDLPLFDVARRMLDPYGYYRQYFGALEPELENDRVLVICVNSTRKWRRKDGEIDELQIRRVEARLRAAPAAKLKIVVAHHPFDVILTRDEANLMHHGVESIRRWAEAGLDLVLGGHIHFPFVSPLRSRYPQLARDVWCVQAGTAVSRRVRHSKPNSFNRLVLGATAEQLIIERWDFSHEDQRFQRVTRVQPWQEPSYQEPLRGGLAEPRGRPVDPLRG